MRLEWLEDILAIAQTGSFIGAAERRHLTQSAFSRRIQQIEDHIGIELFDRSRKPVKLRPTTEAHRAQIEHLSGALRLLVADLRRGDRIAANRIVIASQHSITTSLAPRIIQAVSDAREKIYVRLRSGNLDECFGLLLTRQVDLAIVYRAPGFEEEFAIEFLETLDIGPDRLIPVLRQDLAQAALENGWETEIPIVAYPPDVFFGRIMASQILPAFDPRAIPLPKAETALTIAALELAAAGVAIAWVPETLARIGIQQQRLSDLSPILPSSDLTSCAVRLRGTHGQAEDFIWEQILRLGNSTDPVTGHRVGP